MKQIAAMLDDLHAANKVVGAKQIRRAIESCAAKCVFLPQDADPSLVDPISKLCEASQIECRWVGSMEELGHACKIAVGAAAAAILA